ncbi:hypothetical protein BH11PLA1_BH11PLA1_14590 [soil metagenome]
MYYVPLAVPYAGGLALRREWPGWWVLMTAAPLATWVALAMWGWAVKSLSNAVLEPACCGLVGGILFVIIGVALLKARRSVVYCIWSAAACAGTVLVYWSVPVLQE